MKRILLLLATLFCMALPAAAAAPAFAYNPLSNACGSGGGVNGTSSACQARTTNPIAGPNGVLKKVSVVIAFIAGVAAVIVIIIAGIQLVTSGGDSQAVAKARSAIIGAAIGIVIIAGSESILLFVISKL